MALTAQQKLALALSTPAPPPPPPNPYIGLSPEELTTALEYQTYAPQYNTGWTPGTSPVYQSTWEMYQPEQTAARALDAQNTTSYDQWYAARNAPIDAFNTQWGSYTYNPIPQPVIGYESVNGEQVPVYGDLSQADQETNAILAAEKAQYDAALATKNSYDALSQDIPVSQSFNLKPPGQMTAAELAQYDTWRKANPTPFNARSYLQDPTNADLVTAFGAENYTAAEQHYKDYGQREGRTWESGLPVAKTAPVAPAPRWGMSAPIMPTPTSYVKPGGFPVFGTPEDAQAPPPVWAGIGALKNAPRDVGSSPAPIKRSDAPPSMGGRQRTQSQQVMNGTQQMNGAQPTAQPRNMSVGGAKTMDQLPPAAVPMQRV